VPRNSQHQPADQIMVKTIYTTRRTRPGPVRPAGNVSLISQLVAVVGLFVLSLDDSKTAHARLGRLAQMTTAVGFGEPGVVKFLPRRSKR
jgi:hypothetical protein